MPGLQQLEAEVAICVLTWKGRHPLIPCRAAEKPAPGFFPRNGTSAYSSYEEQMQNLLSLGSTAGAEVRQLCRRVSFQEKCLEGGSGSQMGLHLLL